MAWAGLAWEGAAHEGGSWPGSSWGAAEGSVTVTMPPMSGESNEEIMRDMGRVGFHGTGHYWILGDGHYVWYTLDSVGFDPGDFDTSLSGRIGIEVPLVGGNRTDAQTAAETATAITATAGLSATDDGANVDVTGASTAEAGSRTIDTAGAFGVRGMNAADLSGLNSFANAATSAVLLDNAEIPAEPFIITGFRFTCGNVHAAQVTVAMYQGGSADDDFETATLVGVIGVTTGSATETNLYAETPVPFSVDPSAGRIWIAWSHDAGDYEAPYPLNTSADPIHVAARDSSNWVIDGNMTTREANTVPLSSDPADWPASLPAVTNSTVGMPPITISFVTVAGFQNDMAVVGRFGTRAAAAALIGNSDNTLLVGNSFATPPTIGMSVHDAAVAYDTHESGSDYRISLATGGTSDSDFSGATFYDVGRAVGTDTGWVTVTPTAGLVAIPASTRIFVTIHHTEGTPPVSILAFDALAPDAYSPSSDPAAYYNGNTSESEYDDGTLGGIASTNISFDEGVAQSGVTSPNGDLYNNNNNVGVRMRYAVLGFSVSP